MAPDRLPILLVEQAAQHREVVLLIVDGVVGARRRRPGEHRAASDAGALLEPLVIRNAAGDRPHDVERVEGRHPRARLAQLDPGIRDGQPFPGGTGRDLKEKALRREPVVLRRQTRVQRAPAVVEQQRILAGLLGEHPFGEAGNEDHAKAAAARLLWRADEDPAEPPRRRLGFEQQQPLGEDAPRLVEIDRPDVGHRTQVGEHALDVRRHPQHAWNERLEEAQPLTPCGLGWPAVELLHDRQRKPAQVLELRQRDLEAAEPDAVPSHPRGWRPPAADSTPPRNPQDAAATDPSRCRSPRRQSTTAPSARARAASRRRRPDPRRPARPRSSASPFRARRPDSQPRGRAPRHGTPSIRQSHRRRSTLLGMTPESLEESSSCGTWPSDRYSANRAADSRSAAQASNARKARPAGCGRRVPRSNHAGTSARPSACSRRPK